MSEEERVEFNCNPKTIDWVLGSSLNVYGIQKFMMKMDVYMPTVQTSLIQKVSPNFFQDATNFLAKSNKVKSKNLDSIIAKVIFSDKVQSQIRKQAGSSSGEEGYRAMLKESKQFLKGLSSSIDRKTIQSVFLVFHQRFKTIFD